MNIYDKIFFGNLGPIGIIFAPLWFILRRVFDVIRWAKTPLRQKLCFGRHQWAVDKVLPAEYGVFAGMNVYKCSKCGVENWDLDAERKLKRSGLL